jgi:probable H4MPT-linked C1 transfer pathway protein
MIDCIGVDIGGANLKFSNGLDQQSTVPFELWHHKNELGNVLNINLHAFGPARLIAVTMTGELCDCFESKLDGVRGIVDAVDGACPNTKAVYYQTNGLFVDSSTAVRNWRLTAASNWHAMASFAARFLPTRSGFLVDVGSTTTDTIPITAGRVVATGTCDLSRMLAGELVYSGVDRSPFFASLPQVLFRGQQFPVAQDFFASMLDVYLLLDFVHEDNLNRRTADGRPATKQFAAKRLARSLCADVDELTADEILSIARQAANRQRKLLWAGLEKVVSAHVSIPRQFLVCGQGEWLAKVLVETIENSAFVVPLSDLLSQPVSQVGPAHAVAVLAMEQSCYE